ncbi:ATP-grasp domain-containing protein [Streptomyces tsukubensis]|uniref:ATP-grasp domain-containing protein n=1 Tax=Streptomyces tsukubensis TaxID=83656 RepID=UPI0036B1EE50
MSRKPVLLVLYDNGSMAPTRLAQAARRHDCTVVYALADSPHARSMAPVLGMTGTVLQATTDAQTQVLNELRHHGPDGIVTFSEAQIPATARLAAALGLPYHAPEDIDAITTKDGQRARLADAGVDTLRFRTVAHVDQVEEALAHVGLPAVVKPVSGTSSRNTAIVATARECRRLVVRLLTSGAGRTGEPALVIEEFLAGRPVDPPWGDYLAADCVVSGGEVTPVFVTGKFTVAEPLRERGGYGGWTVVPEPELKEALELGYRAVRALNIRSGLVDFEIKLTERGPRVIEVNGRLGGWVDDLAMRSHGPDPAEIAVLSALGRRPEVPPLPHGGPIAFHYIVVPPPRAERVGSIHGVPALRRIPHVEHVHVHARTGVSVDWRLGGSSGVAAVRGTTETHDQLAETVAEIEKTPWIDYA